MIHIVINSLGRGGAERSVLLLLEQLVRSGVAARLICLFPIADAYEPAPAIRSRITHLNATSFMQACRRLAAGLRASPGDVMFSLMPQANIAAVLVATLKGLRVVTSERTTPLTWYSSRLKLLLALLPHTLSSKAVFISRHALDSGLPANALGRAVRRNAAVLHNPVPCPMPVSEANERRRIRMRRLRTFVDGGTLTSEAPLQLLIASRLAEGKGIVEFLQRAAHFLRATDVRLVIAGAGPLEGQVQSSLARLGIANRVTLRGFVDDIFSAYRNADVVLLTSTSEGFGRVGFEAYEVGCLVVGTQQNSFPGELVHEHAAWHVVKDLSDLGPVLQELAQRPVRVDGADIAQMQTVLGVSTHAARFLTLLEGGPKT